MVDPVFSVMRKTEFMLPGSLQISKGDRWYLSNYTNEHTIIYLGTKGREEIGKRRRECNVQE